MDANKRQRYEKISIELTRLVGGRENIQGVAHCATRLRIVLNDNDLADSAGSTPEAPAEEAFYGYANGRLIAMEDVKDETFANKVLGDGVAVIPSEGKVFAPADGAVTSVFDTKHAICFASRYGTEILIHIGVDTVNLQGKHFTAHVTDGEAVKKGQLLISFDKAQIEKAGYDTAIPMIFTDLPEEKHLKKTAPGTIDASQKAVAVCK